MLQQRNECCDIMEIRRQNFVATMDFYVATLLEKFLKKNVTTFLNSIATLLEKFLKKNVVTFLNSVATLIQPNGSIELSRQSNLCRNIKS